MNMSDTKRAVERRWVLGTIGTGTALGLAGCLGGDSNGSGDDGSLEGPVEFPDDEECAVCDMIAADHPDWNAQLVHENEEWAYFCTTGCLAAYYFTPETFGGPDSAIAGVWATDFETGELVDMDDGFLVYEQDRERHDFPMAMGSPIAFGDESDAVSYVEQYDDLEEDDHVITLADIDESIAVFYRKAPLQGAGYEGIEDEQPAIEPTDFPSDAECAVCNMMAAEHPEWNAQVLHESENREYFCSSGCMLAYYVDQERFGDCQAEIVGVWVTEFETTALIDGTDAQYVRVTDSDHVDDVMMRNPTPFADREDALAFVDDFDEYDEDDVITIDDFDLELAKLYRGKFFE